MKRVQGHICIGCGCSDLYACDEGCSWTVVLDDKHGVCSRCTSIHRKLQKHARARRALSARPPPKRPRK